jgi:large subunit ribosomal protein L21
MYAIIRAGGKQAKVREGDVIDVERIKSDVDEVSFTPLLLVNDDGSVVADRAMLDKATVTAEVVGEHRGPKIEVFTYKNKSGSRRRQGHRQTYTTIKVTGISTGSPKTTEKTAKTTEKTEAAAEVADTDEEA